MTDRHTVDSINSDQLDQLYERAERAEAAVAAVAVKATEWQKLAPADDWGNTPQDTVLADTGRYLLALMGVAATNGPLARVQTALASFDGRGVITPDGGNLDIPTVGEVLDAVRTALTEPDRSAT